VKDAMNRQVASPEESDVSSVNPYLEHHDLIERVIRFVCRRRSLGDEEREEFAGEVRLKLVENDYAVLSSFEGRSSLPTFLTTVVTRLFFDWMRSRRGRPRPSAAARRLGAVAIELERLLYWQGFSFDEACRILQDNHGVEHSVGELESMAGQLPSRAIDRTFEGGERTTHLVSETEPPDESALDRERHAEADRVVAVLEEELGTLDAEDRLVLKMRFESDFKIADIARTLNLPAKPLYRRIEKLLRTLRRGLERRGIGKDDDWWT
jgi:RNA polymerase sigma factor (sigma-70 family)